jgi:flagellar basal-body rod modification protein FlgD
MADVTSTTTSQAVLDQYKLAEDKKDTTGSNLGKDEFLKLMIAQLKNQDPLQPQQNGEFVAQLAQFSQVEGLDNLNGTVDNMASQLRGAQALEASSMVGQAVIVPGNDMGFLQSGDLIAAYAELPATTSNMTLEIQDATGRTLETINLGRHDQGPVSVRWDGANLEVDGQIVDLDRSKLNRQAVLTDSEGNVLKDDNGDPIPAPYPQGKYKLNLSASIDGKTESLGAAMSARVDSVTIGTNQQVTLNLAGGTKAAMSEVRQILE